jgi:energy-coupling factor transport system substrate-specific component
MIELFTMWRSTRMVVLTAISAALYAAALIAFKFLTILPAVTEFRPGVAFVVLCSILFGPAGAWGAAIGNTIGDLAGGLGPGTLVGFFANLLFGLVPYKLYRAMGIEDPTPRTPELKRLLIVVSLTASAVCGVTVGWGIQTVGLWNVAFIWLGNIVFLTNSAMCIGLGGYLLEAIYPRVAALGLRWQEILDVPTLRPSRGRRTLAMIAVTSAAMAWILGNAHEFGFLGSYGPSDLDALVGIPLGITIVALAIAD